MYLGTFRSSSATLFQHRAPKLLFGLGVNTLLAMVIANALVLHSADASDPTGPPDPTPTRGMTQSLDLDLRTDPRKDCRIDGPVEWEPGKLTIKPGGSIHRTGDLGAQARITLRLAFTPLSEDGQSSTTDFAFQVRNRGDFVARLVRRREGGHISAELQLVDRNTPFDGANVTRLLRKFEWKGDFPDAPWTVRLHHGLMTVYCDDKRLGLAYADKEPCQDRRGTDQFMANGQLFPDQEFFHLFGISEPLEISGWSIEQQGKRVACLGASGTASVSYRNEPTWDKNLIDRAMRGAHFYAQSSMREWISIPVVSEAAINDIMVRQNFDKKLSRIKSLLGQQHPDYALAVQGMAAQERWAGMDAEAERLIAESVESSERSLGPWHPDHVAAVVFLAGVYREAGKYDRADALLSQARQATLDVFGAHSVRYGRALRELAVLRRDTGRYADAETLLRESAQACRDSLHDYADTLNTLVDVEARMGETERARELLRQARETLEREVPGRIAGQRPADQKENHLLDVDLASVWTRQARELLRAGQQDAARKQALAAFLRIVGFSGNPIMLGRAPDYVPSTLHTIHPTYGRLMLSLGELFLALGDGARASICLSVSDLVPGRARLERGALYRAVSTLREAYPDQRLRPTNSERYRLESAMEFVRAGSMPNSDRQEFIGLVQLGRGALSKEQQDRLAQLTKAAEKAKQGLGFSLFTVPWRDSILDWRLCALREFERNVGQAHADTIDAVLGLARWQWRFVGPGNAEATLRDAWNRTLQLGDRVLPGLPEVQTYGFLETSRRTADLVLSCYRVMTPAPSVATPPHLNRAGGSPGFAPLFNGKDLAGWRLPRSANQSWEVVDGVLKGSAHPAASTLATERTDFANFHLRVETRMAEGLNSAIQFRITENHGERAAYNVIIGGTTVPENDRDRQTGCLRFLETPRSGITLVTADPVVPIEPGEWFIEEVIADGDMITVLVKGREVAKFKVLHRKLLSGAIGLLCRANAQVAFRKVEIREFGRPGAADTVANGGEPETTPASFDWRRTARVGPAGHWQIENQELVQTTLDRDAWLVFGDRSWTDYTFTADVRVDRSQAHVGLYFRNKGEPRGDNYFYTAGVQGLDGGSICRVTAGNFDVITGERHQDAVLTWLEWHKMRIDVRGKRFTAYLDGHPVFSAFDAANPTGRVGLRSWESICRFRNLKVTAPDGETLWEGLPELLTRDSIGVALAKSSGVESRPPAQAARDCSRDAYEVVWRSKGLGTRLLVERQQLLKAAKGRPDVAKLAEELQSTRQLLARLSLLAPSDAAVDAHRKQLAHLASRKEDLERELARLSESFRQSRDAENLSVAELMRHLPPRTAIVDIVERWQWTAPSKDMTPRHEDDRRHEAFELWTPKRCYDVFVVRPSEDPHGWSVTWANLGNAEGLDRLLNDGIASLRQGEQADNRLPEQMRRALWEPIETSLGDCKRIILIPDGRLAQVPGAALPGKVKGSYLIEDYSLVQAPYGQYVARMLIGPPPEGDGFLLVGGIDYGTEGKWPYLKGTAVEIEQLAKLRPGRETVRLSGESATKTRLRELLPGRRYVHLATHGEFLGPGTTRDARRFLVSDNILGDISLDLTARNPLLLSMLVLAGANRPAPTDQRGLPIASDSFLTAEEVMGMDLSRTELVVLSACETGAGKVREGEGVFSLQRAFQVAGARAVVASLWNVDDRATQALMARFYKILWSHEGKSKGKLEALREAQLWLIREGAAELGRMRGGLERPGPEPRGPLPPSYWAAFVLSGDWR